MCYRCNRFQLLHSFLYTTSIFFTRVQTWIIHKIVIIRKIFSRFDFYILCNLYVSTNLIFYWKDNINFILICSHFLIFDQREFISTNNPQIQSTKRDQQIYFETEVKCHPRNLCLTVFRRPYEPSEFRSSLVRISHQFQM